MFAIFLFPFGVIFLLSVLIFSRKEVENFLLSGIFFGALSIFSGLLDQSIWLSYSKIGILGIGTLFSIGILTILPSSFFKNFFVKIISYFISALIILIFIFHPFFLVKLPGGYSGDWVLIPFELYASLSFGIFCLPFLIIKSRRAKKKVENSMKQ